MKLLSTLSILTGVAAFAVPSLTATTEVATVPVGVVEMTIPAGRSVVAPLFVNANVFQGESTGVSEDIEAETTTISFSSSGFTANEFDEGDFPVYYAESIGDSVSEGFAFDIISNDESSITVAGLLSNVGLTSGQVFAIREHVTLGQFFEGSTGLAVLDEVQFFTSDGGSSIYIWTGSNWFGSPLGDAKPIYPGTGFLTTLSAVVDITTTGTVKSTYTQVPQFSGAINLMSSASPVGKEVGDLDISSQIGILGELQFFTPGDINDTVIIISNGSGDYFGGSGTSTPVDAGQAMLVRSQGSSGYVALPPAYTE
ncbi:hypothetical protein [Cerasicoccus maritimus]|uniref:hypothetical protein n=1 Tax=Cerasicoccus maritimus TaxID=490089 RepID=UPI002852C815|nr:hypothetical protein [Cerasicoccus maritimus]